MRAEEPTSEGSVIRDGVPVAYEVYGTRGPLLVLLPCWIIVHARSWKAQIADFAQDCRVLVIEGRGNGRSGRPAGPEAYTYDGYARDALAVLDELNVEDFAVFGFSMGGPVAALIAQQRPEQTKAVILIAPVAPRNPAARLAREAAFLTPLASYEGWAKYNANYIREDYEGFLRFFFSRMFLEPHSTKQQEDAVSWGFETDASTLVDSTLGNLRSEADISAAYAAISCSVLLMHGDADEIVPITAGRKVAELCRADLQEIPGAGHGPHLRQPALINSAVRSFLAKHHVLASREQGRRSSPDRPRILYLSSPIGLGHVRRDLAVARALRADRPDLQIDWLAQDPVTRMLQHANEHCLPASARLASESRHIETQASEHDLDVFEALRRMDEILVRNFRVFQDVVEGTAYDLIVADEGWEVDHFWHEHPHMKRSPFVWMTDFVGFAATRPEDVRETFLTADYNAEMVGQIERSPGVRDRAIFVGNPADVVDDSLGPNLPQRSDWVNAKFEYSGFILGDDVPLPAHKAELRHRLGFARGEKICVVTVGGSGVGEPLIRRILASLPYAQQLHPELKTIVVAGPRLRPESFPAIRNVEIRGFQPDLPALLCAADLAIVQGGLSTCMELAACQTPYLYFPLTNHFEQEIHVPRRLANYGAGRRMSFADARDPSVLARAMSDELTRAITWTGVERNGAEKAARIISQLL